MDIHPIIWLGVAFLIIREIADKPNWRRTRKRPKVTSLETKKPRTEVVEHSPLIPKPPRLKIGEDGIENGIEVCWFRRNDPEGGWTHIAEGDLIPFLEKNRDYALWYKIVQHDFACGVLEWIVSQPDCPNAVAAAFINGVGPSVFGETEKPSHSAYIYKAVEIVSCRDGTNDFPSDSMRDPEPDEPGIYWSFEKLNRAALLERCNAEARTQLNIGKTPAYSIPQNLLSITPTGPSLRTEYSVDDGGVK